MGPAVVLVGPAVVFVGPTVLHSLGVSGWVIFVGIGVMLGVPIVMVLVSSVVVVCLSVPEVSPTVVVGPSAVAFVIPKTAWVGK